MSSESNIVVYAYTVIRRLLEDFPYQNPNIINSLLNTPQELSDENLFQIFSTSIDPLKKYSLFLLFERFTLNPGKPPVIDPLTILRDMIVLYPNCSESICSSFKSFLLTFIMKTIPTANNLESISTVLAGCLTLNLDVSVEKQFLAIKIQMHFMDSLNRLKLNWELNGILDLINIIHRAQRAGINDNKLVNHVVMKILDTIIEIYDFYDFKKALKESYNQNIIESRQIIRKLENFVDLNDENLGKISLIKEKLNSDLVDPNIKIVDNSLKDIKWREVYKYKRENKDLIVEVVLGELPNNKQVAKKTYILKSDSKHLKIETEIKVIEELSKITRNEESCFLHFYGLELRDNFIAIYMEAYDSTLKDYLTELEEKNLKLTREQIKVFILKLTEAYAHLENLKIIHKDIKPDNILISNDRKILKIIDFSESQIGAAYLSPGIHPIAGTKNYMAPEILKSYLNTESTCNYSPIKADVYSLGLTFYRMVTLESVYLLNQNENNTQILIDHLNTLNLEQWVKLLLIKMLQPDPKNRISFKECLNSIEDEQTYYN